MNPAFSYGALREFLPVFHSTAQKVCISIWLYPAHWTPKPVNLFQTVVKLREHVQQSGKSSIVINAPQWLARTTLDAIGISKIFHAQRKVYMLTAPICSCI